MQSNSNTERMSRRSTRAPQERSRHAAHSTGKESTAARVATRARRQARRVEGGRA